jgi:hypothetical protein
VVDDDHVGRLRLQRGRDFFSDGVERRRLVSLDDVLVRCLPKARAEEPREREQEERDPDRERVREATARDATAAAIRAPTPKYTSDATR